MSMVRNEPHSDDMVKRFGRPGHTREGENREVQAERHGFSMERHGEGFALEDTGEDLNTIAGEVAAGRCQVFNKPRWHGRK